MDIARIVFAVIGAILLATSFKMFLLSYNYHREKGVIYMPKWKKATKKELEQMDERIKKSKYHYIRNIFFFYGAIFLVFGIFCISTSVWLLYPTFALCAIMTIYAIVQSSVNNRKYKKIIEAEKTTARN